ncbi:DUF4291 domain-containing protein [Olleya sp. Bg11-27]|uniref:DUF4291 domain-containing protein n=1 Tax=Olleya sp. Bg11-27 TaxID=2058135 RepID=UPI000C300910|nr:DUF4291 domain-containing protein [Olleya sp. Bg11-27]AUC75170.1 DUF4291 domain-containing protein [Olleya sp. Bg11-27]
MKLKLYKEQLNKWPENGHHIMAQFDEDKIIVYQSYRQEIGDFTAKNQYFGGAFSLNRMTWIKPNFLWTMYRNGWGTKEGQEVVLAIHLKLEAFERYLEKAVYSSFQKEIYSTKEDWQNQVKASSVRLQWDPDHNPYGAKEERRAIQIGLRNDQIERFSKEDVLKIEDISSFVKQQHEVVLKKQLDKLLIPEEYPFFSSNEEVNRKLKLK